MTQEEKNVLFKDLCARWPYGVNVQIRRSSLNLTKPVILDLPIKGVINFASTDSVITVTEDGDIVYDPISNCKPYLRPMSSMTEEERLEFSKLLDRRYCEEDWEGHISTSYCIEIDNVYTDDEGIIKYPSSFSMDAIDWLNAHHFDYRGLIGKGLALEAPEGIYK